MEFAGTREPRPDISIAEVAALSDTIGALLPINPFTDVLSHDSAPVMYSVVVRDVQLRRLALPEAVSLAADQLVAAQSPSMLQTGMFMEALAITQAHLMIPQKHSD